jgi:superfamily II DNA/RNA helicase
MTGAARKGPHEISALRGHAQTELYEYCGWGGVFRSRMGCFGDCHSSATARLYRHSSGTAMQSRGVALISASRTILQRAMWSRLRASPAPVALLRQAAAVCASHMSTGSVKAVVLTPEGESHENELVARGVDTFELRPELAEQLRAEGIESLFPVQVSTIEHTLAEQDIVVRSRTGSGKTLGFAVPVIELMLRQNAKPVPRRAPRCIVLAPTRELAKQVALEFSRVIPPRSRLRATAIYGGASIQAQADELERGVDIVVGTPGRVLDLINRSSLDLSQIQFAVLDEADEMLRMGFKEDVEAILKHSPSEKHSMLWSATVPNWVRSLARDFLHRPAYVDLVGDDAGKLPHTIEHTAVRVPSESTRKAVLVRLVQTIAANHRADGRSSSSLGDRLTGSGRPDPGATLRVLVFTETQRDTDEVAQALARNSSLRVQSLHGGLAQSIRESTLRSFRDGQVAVLVATDVAARGLDVPSVTAVIHFTLPQGSEQFTHRTGRTGRAGASGVNYVLSCPSDNAALGALESELGFRFAVQAAPTVAARARPEDEAALTVEAQRRLAVADRSVASGSVVDGVVNSMVSKFGSEREALCLAVASLLGLHGAPAESQVSLMTGQVGGTTFALNNRKASSEAIAKLSPLEARAAVADVYESAGLPRRAVPTVVFPSSVGVLFDVADLDVAEKLRKHFGPGEAAEGGWTSSSLATGDYLVQPDRLPCDLSDRSVFAKVSGRRFEDMVSRKRRDGRPRFDDDRSRGKGSGWKRGPRSNDDRPPRRFRDDGPPRRFKDDGPPRRFRDDKDFQHLGRKSHQHRGGEDSRGKSQWNSRRSASAEPQRGWERMERRASRASE